MCLKNSKQESVGGEKSGGSWGKGPCLAPEDLPLCLLIVRHAKSSWKDPHLVDHQCPLNERGKKAAQEMGRRLQKRGVWPDVIV